jgi:hypothetical protein
MDEVVICDDCDTECDKKVSKRLNGESSARFEWRHLAVRTTKSPLFLPRPLSGALALRTVESAAEDHHCFVYKEDAIERDGAVR